MTTDTNLDRICRVIAEQLGAERVDADDALVEKLGADSLDLIEIVMAVEDEFGVEIPDEAAETCTTPRRYAEVVAGLK